MSTVKALAWAALAVILCGCGSRHPAGEAADENRVALEGLSLRVPPGWDSYMDDIGPWMPEPEIWAANVSLPERAAGVIAAPYEVLPDLPRRGIVVMVMAPADSCEFNSSLQVDPVDILDDGYEGQPAPHVASWSTSGVRDGRCLYAQAWFGVNEPDESLRSELNHVLASVELEPEPKPGSDPGWKTYRDAEARLALRYPPGWRVADDPLMPLLIEPRELVTLSTSALSPADASCPQVPEAAVEALGPKEALISVLEFRSKAHAPPRPSRLLPYEGRHPATCKRLQLPHGLLYSVQSFEDVGRVLDLYVAVGESASDQIRRELTEILNTLFFD